MSVDDSAMTDADRAQIPVVDFSSWNGAATPGARKKVALQLADACRRVGFVYIVNHGIRPELLDEAFTWTQRLFALGHDDKMLAPHPDGPDVHRGYSYPGLEKVSRVASETDDVELVNALRQTKDCKESYEIGSECNEEQPNVWLPDQTLPGFREFTTSFYWECWKVSQAILRAMAIGIGLDDEDFLLKFHSGDNNQLRLLHYPPVSFSDLNSQAVARMPEHTDWGSITMLFQDDCGGLEVEDPNRPGTFVRAPPLKNACIMNVGDMLMRWSNDYLKSTVHRVSLSPLDNSVPNANGTTRDRYSIPYFVSPDSHSIVECLPSCTDAKNPVKYQPLLQDDYRRMRARLQYQKSTAIESV